MIINKELVNFSKLLPSLSVTASKNAAGVKFTQGLVIVCSFLTISVIF